MIVLGVICTLLGYFLGVQWLWILGVILLVIGAVLLLLATVGGRTSVGGRRYWY